MKHSLHSYGLANEAQAQKITVSKVKYELHKKEHQLMWVKFNIE